MQQQLHIEMWLDFRPTFSSRVSLLFKPFLSVTLDHLHKTAKNKNMILNFPQSFYPWFRKRSLNEDCKRIVNKTKQINHCAKKEVFIAKVCQAYLSIAQQFFFNLRVLPLLAITHCKWARGKTFPDLLDSDRRSVGR